METIEILQLLDNVLDGFDNKSNLKYHLLKEQIENKILMKGKYVVVGVANIDIYTGKTNIFNSQIFVGRDFGTDPRAFIGWENSTKMIFFYSQLVSATVCIPKKPIFDLKSSQELISLLRLNTAYRSMLLKNKKTHRMLPNFRKMPNFRKHFYKLLPFFGILQSESFLVNLKI